MGPITDLITSQRKEFDITKRNAIIKDIQKQLAVQMAAVPVGGLSLDFALQWPYLGNRGWFLEFTGTPERPRRRGDRAVPVLLARQVEDEELTRPLYEKGPFMLSQQETDLLCQVGPGTPMGEVFRRFWIPVLLSEEVPEPDTTPVAIRILGEDLLAFRATSGKVGLTSAYCPHRHAHLFWGRNEEEGIRCTYHGWKYDTTGQCVDMPNEPGDLSFKDKIKIRSYPTMDAGGAIWAYMGPPERQPDLHQLEWTRVPAENVLVTKRLQENNWAQAVEGGIDSSHISYLHNNDMYKANNSTVDKSPQMTVSPRDFGFIEAARRNTADGKHYWRIRPFLVPSSIIIPGGDQPGRNLSGHVWVPLDDEHVWTYTITWNAERPLTQEERDSLLAGTGIHCPVDKDVRRWDLKTEGLQADPQHRQRVHDRPAVAARDVASPASTAPASRTAPSRRAWARFRRAGRSTWARRTVASSSSAASCWAWRPTCRRARTPEHASRPEAYRVRSTAFVVEPEADWESDAAAHMKAIV